MRSILKPEVYLVMFLRMRSDETWRKNSLKMQFGGLISRAYIFLGERSEFEVHFEIGIRLHDVSAHAQ